MSMGFLLPRKEGPEVDDTAIVWRGLMVQKATQQLLFDVDWRETGGSGVDALVIDMPPGTGDVPLTLGQLVNVDGRWLWSAFSHCPHRWRGRGNHRIYSTRRSAGRRSERYCDVPQDFGSGRNTFFKEPLSKPGLMWRLSLSLATDHRYGIEPRILHPPGFDDPVPTLRRSRQLPAFGGSRRDSHTCETTARSRRECQRRPGRPVRIVERARRRRRWWTVA